MKILSVEEMRKLDSSYIYEYGISQEVLMENASLGAFEVLKKNDLHLKKNTLVVCGNGNNGGDGIALARKIYSLNEGVSLLFFKDPHTFTDAPLTNFIIADKLGIPWKVIKAESLKDIQKEISEAEIIIDGIFGTGLDRVILGLPHEIICEINRSSSPVISLDIPSGLNGNSGNVTGVAIEADYTVTFGTLKYGHLVGKGRKYCGRLYRCNISFPQKFTQEIETSLNIPSPMPKRDVTGYKSSFGKALFVSGCRKYMGAPFFNCSSFLNLGGGYATLFSTREVIDSVSSFAREVVFMEAASTDEGALSYMNLQDILTASSNNNITAIGSGISFTPLTAKLVKDVVNKCDTPIIIDGDGITAISKKTEILSSRNIPAILTPHLGEFSRLVDMPIEEIQKDRVGILKEAAKNLNAFIILKEATTLIASPEGKLLFSTTGNSGMGVAGTGDLLVGVLAAALSFLPPMEACSLAVFLHGFAGDITAKEWGEEGVLPTRILENLPLAVKEFRENYFSVINSYIPEEI